MGGQIGDCGTIQTAEGSVLFEVAQTQTPYPGVILHIGTMKKGAFKKNDPVIAQIDAKKRQQTCNNHSATHLLHLALNTVLGSHIKQTGSFVESERFRFDFSHHKALSKEELRQIEDLVNQKIREDREIEAKVINYTEAQKDRSIKQFFGDKYGSNVRVISIGDSKELCGGTHTKRTGQIGFFKILKESSIAAGTRRIEAVSGAAAEKLIQGKEDLLSQLSSLLKTSEAKLTETLNHLIKENHHLKEQQKEKRKVDLKILFGELLKKKVQKGPLAYILAETALEASELPQMAGALVQALQSALVVLSAKTPEKCLFYIAVSADLAEQGLAADLLIKKIAPLIKGGGGGTKTAAQAGGSAKEKSAEALKLLEKLLEDRR
jgi:alanyl-tRNA synthetase